MAAFQAQFPNRKDALLVDIGAGGTVLALLLQGQPVQVGTFALGGEALTEMLVSRRGCSFEKAEVLKESLDLDRPEDASVIDDFCQRWVAELRHVLDEWERDQPTFKEAREQLTVHVCGGTAALPRFTDSLARHSPLSFSPWTLVAEEDELDSRFVVAWGAALHALGRAPNPASLLPDEVRVYWDRHHALQVLHSIIFLMLGVLALVLGFATWQKWDAYRDKVALRDQSEMALSRARSAEALGRRLSRDYEALRPILQGQRETLQVLQVLGLLQQVRTNHSFWYVLFADQRSYFSALPFGATNAPALVEETPAEVDRGDLRGFITEICVPDQGEARRRAVSQIVQELKSSRLLRNADSLPDDQRRSLINPDVLIPEGHYALVLELTETPFIQASRPLFNARTNPGRSNALVEAPLGLIGFHDELPAAQSAPGVKD
jgi:hypothetical protein